MNKLEMSMRRSFVTVKTHGLAFLAATAVLTPAIVTGLGEPAFAEQTECTSSLPPGTYGHIVVPGGATCILRDSVVSGNVRALPGGTLVAETTQIGGNLIGRDVNRLQVGRSAVGGNIVVHGGQPVSGPPLAFSVCATSVDGNVIIQKVTGGIGVRTSIPTDPPTGLGARCGSVRNEIGGNLIVSNNDSFRTLVLNNIVRGNMRVVNNRGPGEKTFAGNEVAGSLVCVRNEEPFTSSANSAARTSGQCAS